MPRRFFSETNTARYVLGLFNFSLSRLRSFIMICACLLILVLFNSQSPNSQSLRLKSIEIATYIYAQISSPIWLVNDSYKSVTKTFEKFTSNEKLLIENKRLRQYINEMEILVGENNRLKELLKFDDDSRHAEIFVRILSNSFNAFSKTFTINVGKNAGVNEGSILVNDEGLIGKVLEATASTSKVQAITDVNSKIPAIFAHSRKRCVLVGQDLSNNSLKATFTEPDLIVQDGEPVITSGDGNLVPYGILIGFAFNNENSIEVKTSVNWADLDFGKVIVNEIAQ